MLTGFVRLWHTLAYSAHWFWQSFKIIRPLWQLFRLHPPRVTFFGGGRLALTDQYAQDARTLAHWCAQHEITIITGGGGGIMQAAALGASQATQASNVGITITGLSEYQLWPAHEHLLRVDNLIIRKWLMFNFSVACIIFPGGVGTYNEFAEVLTLIDMKLFHRIPILLYGKEYWQPFLDWMTNDGVNRGFIKANILKTFTVVNTVPEAFELLQKTCCH